jgi:serine/threonine protein kinase
MVNREITYHDHLMLTFDMIVSPINVQTKARDTDIKLADFGFAKRIPIVNACRTLCGTPGYLAPEILERWPSYDTKCDLWSVGVILFLLLGGYLPFEDEDEDKVFERTRNGMYEFHPHYWGGVSNEAKELVTKLLTINPSKRFSAQQALNHKYMMTMNEQALQQQSVDVNKLKISLNSGKNKLKAAINAVVAANRLQELSDDFNKYLENKRAVEPTFQKKYSVHPNTKSNTLDSATGMPFGDFYLLGELVSQDWVFLTELQLLCFASLLTFLL